MRLYTVAERLPSGQLETLASIACRDDAEASDEVSTRMFPAAEIWDGDRFVAKLRGLW